jgi:hypothetical protein
MNRKETATEVARLPDKAMAANTNIDTNARHRRRRLSHRRISASILGQPEGPVEEPILALGVGGLSWLFADGLFWLSDSTSYEQSTWGNIKIKPGLAFQ